MRLLMTSSSYMPPVYIYDAGVTYFKEKYQQSRFRAKSLKVLYFGRIYSLVLVVEPARTDILALIARGWHLFLQFAAYEFAVFYLTLQYQI